MYRTICVLVLATGSLLAQPPASSVTIDTLSITPDPTFRGLYHIVGTITDTKMGAGCWVIPEPGFPVQTTGSGVPPNYQPGEFKTHAFVTGRGPHTFRVTVYGTTGSASRTVTVP